MPLFAAALFAAAVLVGCGPKPEDKVIGTWQFKDLGDLPAGIPASYADGVKKALSSTTLVFNKDKSFALALPNSPLAGSWVIDEKGVQMTTKTIAGVPPAEFRTEEIGKLEKVNPTLAQRMKSQPDTDHAMIGTVSVDGKSISVVPRDGKSGTLLFAKNPPAK